MIRLPLTDIGKEVKSVLDIISVWGEKYIEYMKVLEIAPQ